MKQIALTLSLLLTTGTLIVAGPETYSGKEMKQVAQPMAPECNWTGFYLGINAGGQFGHSETVDLDGYDSPDGNEHGYSESSPVVGGQIGYNWQWNHLVLGPEVDVGYINIDGSGVSGNDRREFDSDTRDSTESDFYSTFRGRIGFAWDKWLFYGTGGGIAVNFKTSTDDPRDVSPAGDDSIAAHDQEFDWGWCAGGGVERMIGCHWSIKAEYLHYILDDQDYGGTGIDSGEHFNFTGKNEGNIFRAGLNYRF